VVVFLVIILGFDLLTKVSFTLLLVKLILLFFSLLSTVSIFISSGQFSSTLSSKTTFKVFSELLFNLVKVKIKIKEAAIPAGQNHNGMTRCFFFF